MYRVELKGKTKLTAGWLALAVPNVPCGVESLVDYARVFDRLLVPNVPCGVERTVDQMEW